MIQNIFLKKRTTLPRVLTVVETRKSHKIIKMPFHVPHSHSVFQEDFTPITAPIFSKFSNFCNSGCEISALSCCLWYIAQYYSSKVIHWFWEIFEKEIDFFFKKHLQVVLLCLSYRTTKSTGSDFGVTANGE